MALFDRFRRKNEEEFKRLVDVANTRNYFGNYKGAADFYEKAARLAPDNEKKVYSDMAAEARKREEASRLQTKEGNAERLVEEANNRYTSGDYEGAARLYERAAYMSSNTKKTRLYVEAAEQARERGRKIREQQAEEQRQKRIDEKLQRKMTPEVRRKMGIGIDLAHPKGESPAEQASSEVEQANDLYTQGDYEGAARLYEKAASGSSSKPARKLFAKAADDSKERAGQSEEARILEELEEARRGREAWQQAQHQSDEQWARDQEQWKLRQKERAKRWGRVQAAKAQQWAENNKLSEWERHKLREPARSVGRRTGLFYRKMIKPSVHATGNVVNRVLGRRQRPWVEETSEQPAAQQQQPAGGAGPSPGSAGFGPSTTQRGRGFPAGSAAGSGGFGGSGGAGSESGVVTWRGRTDEERASGGGSAGGSSGGGAPPGGGSTDSGGASGGGGAGGLTVTITSPSPDHTFQEHEIPNFKVVVSGGTKPYDYIFFYTLNKQDYDLGSGSSNNSRFSFQADTLPPGDYLVSVEVEDRESRHGRASIRVSNKEHHGGLELVIERPMDMENFSLADEVSVPVRIRVANARPTGQYEIGIYKLTPGLGLGDLLDKGTASGREFIRGTYFDFLIPTKKLGEGTHVLRFTVNAESEGRKGDAVKTVIVGQTLGPTEMFKDKPPVSPEALGAGPKQAWRLGKGAGKRVGVRTDVFGGTYTAMPGLRYSIMGARNYLRKLARRRGNELVRQQEALINMEDKRLKEFSAERKKLEKERNRIISKFKKDESVSFADAFGNKKPAGLEKFTEFMGGVMETKLSKDQASRLISDKIEEMDRAERNLRDQLRKQVRFEQVFTELKGALDIEATRLANDIAWKWRLSVTHMNRPDELLALKEYVTGELAVEAQRLAYFYQSTAQSRMRRLLGHGSLLMENVGEVGRSAGDLYLNIITNLYDFITGPWVVGALVLLVQWLFVGAYIHPYSSLYLYVFPGVAAAALLLINLSNSKYPMDFLTHAICGGIIGYSAVILITALNIHMFVSTFWLWVIFLALGFLGAFQIYAPGGFKTLLPLALVILLFGYIAMGPYSASYRVALDQVKAPLKLAYMGVKNTVEGVVLLATNPTEWYARQQLVNVRPERPMDGPKAVEISMLEALPDSPPADTEFAVVAVLENEGDMEATGISADVSCDNYCRPCTGSEKGCRGPVESQLPKKMLLPGEGTRIELSHILAESMESTTIKRSTWQHVAKMSLNVTYGYKTSSSLLVEVMSAEEIDKRFRERERVYRNVVAVGKVGPAELSINVGPQPLHAGSKAMLLLSISNKRWDGAVRLGDGDKVTINLPAEIGSGLDCGAISQAYTCTSAGNSAECTITGEHVIEAYKFNQIIPFLCSFKTRNAGVSVTGLVTAELEHYRFTVTKQKDLIVGPKIGIVTPGGRGYGSVSPEATGKIISKAQAYIGCPYRKLSEGCTIPPKPEDCNEGTNGFTCATFVQKVFADAGLDGPTGDGKDKCGHDALKGNKFGDSSSLMPGDVFSIYTGGDGHGHAGIYVGRGTISGDCKAFTPGDSGEQIFIHASSGYDCDSFEGVKYVKYSKLFGRLDQNDYTFCRHKDAIITEDTVGGSDSVTKISVTKSQLSNYLTARNSALLAHASDFYDLGVEYQIDPAFAIAVAIQESGDGISNAAKTKNNFFGIGPGNTYPTPKAGIEAFYKLIKEKYVPKGQDTPDKIICFADGKYQPALWSNHCYCTSEGGAGCPSWSTTVAKIRADVQKTPNTQ